MNNRLWVLVKGELVRLHKYNFTFLSVFVAIMWGVMLYIMNDDLFSSLLPFILMIDATLMAVMYVGAVMYFEKNESTISTMLVTPITNGELILSKVISYTLHNLLGSILIITTFIFIKDVEVNIPLMLLGIITATGFHTIAGICLSYFQKDFTGMLLQIILISFALFIPTALVQFGVLTGDFWDYLLLVNPVAAAQTIISGGINGFIYEFDYYFSLFYLLIGAVLLYRFFALPKFQDYAIKQSGV